MPAALSARGVLTSIPGTGIFTLPTSATAPTTITRGTDTITLLPPVMMTPPAVTGTGFLLPLASSTVIDGTTHTYPCNTGTASSTVTLGRETIVLTGCLALPERQSASAMVLTKLNPTIWPIKKEVLAFSPNLNKQYNQAIAPHQFHTIQSAVFLTLDGVIVAQLSLSCCLRILW